MPKEFKIEVSGKEITIKEHNWKNIHEDFTSEVQKEWENLGFDYQETYWLIDNGLMPNEFAFAEWLRNIKNVSPQPSSFVSLREK